MSLNRHSSEEATGRKLPRGPLLIVAAAFLLPLVFITLPNWSEFASNLSQFSALWQITGNRHELVNNIIRICSPLLLATIAAGCCWLWYTIRFYRRGSFPEAAPGQGDGNDWRGSRQERHFSSTSNTKRAPAPSTAGHESDAHEEEEDLFEEDEFAEELGEERASASDAEATPIYLTIGVLGKLSLTLHVPNGKSYTIQHKLNALNIQLLAYLAWNHGRAVSLDRLREHIYGYGKDDEAATPQRLQEALDSSKKEIRRVIRLAVERVNRSVGHEAIPSDLNPFAIGNKHYWLAGCCRVADLCAIEAEHAIIQQAFEAGLLIDNIPVPVRQACLRLRKVYKVGDFLAEEIADTTKELGSWVRKPFTQYRDYFFQALLFSAEYHLRAGQRLANEFANEPLDAKQQKRLRGHFGRAASLYRLYASRACDSRADLKVSFGGGSRTPGERVDMSERALRRFLVLMGVLGDPGEANTFYNNYVPYMKKLSSNTWEPSQDTLADLKSAQEQTGAYRSETLLGGSIVLPPSAQVVQRS